LIFAKRRARITICPTSRIKVSTTDSPAIPAGFAGVGYQSEWMVCFKTNVGGSSVIICGPRRPYRKCPFCKKRPASLECDFEGEPAKLKSRVTLAPFRTFTEVEQPASDFIFRAKQMKPDSLPQLALFEADGGKWRLAAIENIAAFLRNHATGVQVIS
jgi:hypothetical protein